MGEECGSVVGPNSRIAGAAEAVVDLTDWMNDLRSWRLHDSRSMLPIRPGR